ncbi:hypothetical protein [Xylophilus sp.]|uniref:hypothetical protein n=1 Tax=Xylophilus sp. TaxID=2653893 RepID=UPI0013B7BE95|nr:hypothetical protein [Xylophilus sp.]KAF1045007.1 MAG: hypothetical protein GAK38_03233 [Xylophilus sp.]
MNAATALRLGLLIVAASQAGCSILSPEPTWELIKATGGLAAVALSQAPAKATNTVYHLHAPFKKVCIEFNPRTQVPDMVPALQAELRNRGIESRVFDSETAGRNCPVWLR